MWESIFLTVQKRKMEEVIEYLPNSAEEEDGRDDRVYF